MVADEAGRWLILRRTRPPEQWMLPGGRVLPGESPAAAAIRETREETGLRVDAGDLLAVAFVAPSYPRLSGRLAFVFAAALPAPGHEIRPDGVEVDRWQFAEPARALELLHPLMAARLATPERRSVYIEQRPQRADH
ncbi:NUDIX hydrolase [Actinospica durhamensis]|uniref:NUDIX hydrolase n=1 Tax=Actinospica durhamensis TaxID=1508375 RepID=A0A941ELC8_9ACTN|nr:NUDIX hydrolase [Actinospica durhamensis]MBR7832473.1 NUDIX hydrolase [Actinospica durhamensis]